jgi:hypothetical protein
MQYRRDALTVVSDIWDYPVRYRFDTFDQKAGVDSHIKLNKPSHEQLNNFAGKLTDRPPCGKAAG